MGSRQLSVRLPRVGVVRILHTSDWHLGRSFHRVGMLGAQADLLDHLVDVVRSERVQVVLVSGDVYDRAIPSVDVVSLLDEGLNRLVAAGAQVILTAGNHDSTRRLAFGSRLLESAGVHIRADLGRLADPVIVADEHGPVAFYPLPYLEPVLTAGPLECPTDHTSVLTAAMSAVRTDLAARPAGTRSVVAAHAFVVGGQGSDSERDITVGGVASVAREVFDGVDYVALGHLHGRQRLRDDVRYSGSPLAYSFSEHAQTKGTLLVELDAGGLAAVTPVDAPVPRPLALLRGTLEELLWRGDLVGAERAWCQATLTDPQRPERAMERLRARFPHTLELRFEPVDDVGRAVATDRAYRDRLVGRSDLDICVGFLDHVRSRPAGELERDWLSQALAAARLDEAEARGVAVLRDEARRAARNPKAPATDRAGATRREVS